MMEFIRDLHEARMTKDQSNIRNLTYSDCCEKMYLILLTLDLMKHYPRYTSFVHDYAKRTKHHNYKGFRSNGTDLYNFIYFIQGDDRILSKLKNPGAAQRTQAMSAIPMREISKYIVDMSTGTPATAQQMFIRIENGLHINNQEYRELRRYIGRFQHESPQAKKNIATKLLYALRAKLRNSDIIDDFSKLVAQQDLETSRVDDTEIAVSKPDLGTNLASVKFYRLLASPSKLILLQKFLEYTKEGKPIPANMVKAYSPIVELVDDIVQGGPTYIQMLKTIRKNAKKSDNG